MKRNFLPAATTRPISERGTMYTGSRLSYSLCCITGRTARRLFGMVIGFTAEWVCCSSFSWISGALPLGETAPRALSSSAENVERETTVARPRPPSRKEEEEGRTHTNWPTDRPTEEFHNSIQRTVSGAQPRVRVCTFSSPSLFLHSFLLLCPPLDAPHTKQNLSH